MRNASEMFSFGPNPTRAENAWPSSTCLLYDLEDVRSARTCTCFSPKASYKSYDISDECILFCIVYIIRCSRTEGCGQYTDTRLRNKKSIQLP
jgi:hypothetical protein